MTTPDRLGRMHGTIATPVAGLLAALACAGIGAG
jgi:hypothetical protein